MLPVNVTAEQAIAIFTAGLVIVGLMQVYAIWRQRREPDDSATAPSMYRSVEFPKIHSTSGVPTLEQLTRDIELNPKDRRLTQALYDWGFNQYNHYVNNRDGIITDAQEEMEELRRQLNQSEISLADGVGIALADTNHEIQKRAQVQFDDLSPKAKIYAQQKRREHQSLETIASDLEKNVPRTDYTLVRKRIETGEVLLDAILSELPFTWQLVRKLSERPSSRPPTVKPPRREFVHVVAVDREARTFWEDSRAERHGKWVEIHRYGAWVPYQEPEEILMRREDGKIRAPTLEYVMLIDRPPGIEWTTEFWRQGGFVEQQWRLAWNGMLPDQVRRRYRWRLFSRSLWTVAGVLLTIDFAWLLKLYVL